LLEDGSFSNNERPPPAKQECKPRARRGPPEQSVPEPLLPKRLKNVNATSSEAKESTRVSLSPLKRSATTALVELSAVPAKASAEPSAEVSCEPPAEVSAQPPIEVFAVTPAAGSAEESAAHLSDRSAGSPEQSVLQPSCFEYFRKCNVDVKPSVIVKQVNKAAKLKQPQLTKWHSIADKIDNDLTVAGYDDMLKIILKSYTTVCTEEKMFSWLWSALRGLQHSSLEEIYRDTAR
jgi:hypothetical protein